MSESHRTFLRTKGTLLGRSLIGLLFLVSGVSMLLSMGVSGLSGVLSGMGIPLSGLAAVLVLATKILGGASLILGYKVDCAAQALFIFTLLTVVFVHNNMEELTAALKNLSIMGGLLYILAYGPGDGWRIARSA